MYKKFKLKAINTIIHIYMIWFIYKMEMNLSISIIIYWINTLIMHTS